MAKRTKIPGKIKLVVRVVWVAKECWRTTRSLGWGNMEICHLALQQTPRCLSRAHVSSPWELWDNKVLFSELLSSCLWWSTREWAHDFSQSLSHIPFETQWHHPETQKKMSLPILWHFKGFLIKKSYILGFSTCNSASVGFQCHYKNFGFFTWYFVHWNGVLFISFTLC